MALALRNLILANGIAPDGILFSQHNQEMVQIDLSNWEWIFFLSILMLLVWVLIVFQARQHSSHEVELTAKVDPTEEGISQNDDHN